MSNQQNFKYKKPALGMALILLLVSSGIAIYLIPQYAYLYVGFIWLVFVSLFVKYSKTEKARLIGIYTGSVILAFSLAEVYFTYQFFDQDFYEVESIYGGHNYTHKVLGTAPTPDSQWKSKLYNHDTLIYDVINTIDSHGFRSSPQQDTVGQDPVLFFGCLFTFGLGLNDDETLPHYFHLTAPAAWHSYNMGYNGYGVHHTLAMLQNHMEVSVLQGKQPKAAFYSAITHHVFRGTGRIINNEGPRYKLTAQGQVVPRLTKALDGRENVHRAK